MLTFVISKTIQVMKIIAEFKNQKLGNFKKEFVFNEKNESIQWIVKKATEEIMEFVRTKKVEFVNSEVEIE